MATVVAVLQFSDEMIDMDAGAPVNVGWIFIGEQ
jgi:hypothetical protein